MSSERERHRGRLFENKDKRKPSQPDMQGTGQLDGKPYAISAWDREDQLVLSFAPPRTGKNTYPPEEFRGALDPAPRRGKKGSDGPPPLWVGEIDGEEGAFSVRAFEKQGKSGSYLTLELDGIARAEPAPTPEPEPAPEPATLSDSHPSFD
jgi:hypothetical protein